MSVFRSCLGPGSYQILKSLRWEHFKSLVSKQHYSSSDQELYQELYHVFNYGSLYDPLSEQFTCYHRHTSK